MNKKFLALTVIIVALLPSLGWAASERPLLNQSQLLLEQGKPDKVVELVSLADGIGSPEIHKVLARALVQLGKNNEVIELLTNSEHMDWELYYLLALAYHNNGHYSHALNELEKGLALRPHTTLLLNQSAAALQAMGNYEEAISKLEQSLRFDGSQFHLHWRIGAWAEAVGDLTTAQRSYRAAQGIRRVSAITDRLAEIDQKLQMEAPTQVSEPKAITPVQHLRVARHASSEMIRIGLLESAVRVVISAGSSFSLTDQTGNSVSANGGELWTITSTPQGRLLFSTNERQHLLTQPVRLTLADEETTFALYNVDYGQGYFWAGQETRQYRGSLEILLFSAGITVVNELPLEEYLYSVVAAEMSPSWHMEALKAQAVAARSYSEFNRGRYQARGFDLLSSVLSAYYPGVGRENPRTTTAVDATWGEIMTYQGKPINAVYSSNNGGIQSSSEEVWGGHRPYLASGSDGGLLPSDPFSLANWLTQDAPAYSNIGRQYSSLRWARSYSREDLERIAPATIGELVDVFILSVAGSHRVQSIRWVGTKDSVTVSGDSIRGSLGGVRSNLFIFYPAYHNGRIEQLTILGAGWGHGVGMSQSGALGMAEAGYTYRDILEHYYRNAELK